MFLEYGLDHNAEWVHISNAKRGKTTLVCPFCKQQLIARKGDVMTHHFAHAGETCRESEQALILSQIPTIDRWELLEPAEQMYIDRRRQYKHNQIYHFKSKDEAVKSLAVMGILDVIENPTDGLSSARKTLASIDPTLLDGDQPSEKLEGIFTALRALGITSDRNLGSVFYRKANIETTINRAYHTNKLDKQGSIAKLYKAQTYWLDAYYRKVASLYSEAKPLVDARFANLASQHLYLFEIDDVLKVGMTTRDAETRLSEVVKELGGARSATVLRFVKNAGRVEFLVHDLFRPHSAELGNHQEYFKISAKEKLITQFDELIKIKPEPYRPPLINGGPASTVKLPGRKAKTDSQVVAEYPDVVTALKAGKGIRPTSRITGRAVNTVQKVAQAMARLAGQD